MASMVLIQFSISWFNITVADPGFEELVETYIPYFRYRNPYRLQKFARKLTTEEKRV